MDELIKSQSDVISKINAFNNNFNKADKNNRTKGYWSSRREQLMSYWKSFEENHTQALNVYVEAEHHKYKYFSADYYSVTDEAVHSTLGNIEDQIELLKDDNGEGNTSRSLTVKAAEFKLPRLELPIFNGDYESWSSFHDLYVAAVHSKTEIPGVQKLQFLKSRLKGDAEALLRSFQITEANYAKAWQSLIDRYDNKRVLVTTQLRTLFSQSKASETADGIRKVVDTTTQCITALENLGVNTKHWDVIVVFLISQRLPIETLSLWEQSLKTRELPTVEKGGRVAG